METKTGDGEKGHMKLVRDLDRCGVEIGWVMQNCRDRLLLHSGHSATPVWTKPRFEGEIPVHNGSVQIVTPLY
jgi:hypothetical protein